MVDADLVTLCQQDHEAFYRASAFYGRDLTYESLPIYTDGSIDFNASSEIQTTASLTLAKNGGESLIPPRSKADVLAPYGQEIRIQRVDRFGAREFVTDMGQLRVSEIPSMKAYVARFPDRYREQGWLAKITLVDRFDQIRADKFLAPAVPNFENTTWEEIQRFSNIPIVQNPDLPDRALPAGLAYEDRSRFDTIVRLFENLGGVPSLTRLGSLTGRVKDAWLTATVPEYTINGVIDMDDSLTNDVYNSVRVESSDGLYVGIAEITDPGDPLSVYGPLGRRVYEQSSPLYSSYGEVDGAAATILARVSTRRSKSVSVACLPHPYLELGMFIQVIDKGRSVLGEITKMGFSMNGTSAMKLDLIVAETG